MTVSKAPDTYQVEDIQEILQLAIARRDTDAELTRAQLEEIAADMGIPKSDLVAAEQAWIERRVATGKKQIFNLQRRQMLKSKAIRFSIINSFLLGINTLNAGHPSWSLYVLLVWGLFLSLKGWQLWQTSGENYENEFQKWDRKMQLKESVQTLWQKFQQFLNSAP